MKLSNTNQYTTSSCDILLYLNIENNSMKEERKSYLMGKISLYIENKIESTSTKYARPIPRPIKHFLGSDKGSILENYNYLA